MFELGSKHIFITTAEACPSPKTRRVHKSKNGIFDFLHPNRKIFKNTLDSHTVGGIIIITSSKNSNLEVPLNHAKNRRIFKIIQSQRQNASPL